MNPLLKSIENAENGLSFGQKIEEKSPMKPLGEFCDTLSRGKRRKKERKTLPEHNWSQHSAEWIWETMTGVAFTSSANQMPPNNDNTWLKPLLWKATRLFAMPEFSITNVKRSKKRYKRHTKRSLRWLRKWGNSLADIGLRNKLGAPPIVYEKI